MAAKVDLQTVACYRVTCGNCVYLLALLACMYVLVRVTCSKEVLLRERERGRERGREGGRERKDSSHLVWLDMTKV